MRLAVNCNRETVDADQNSCPRIFPVCYKSSFTTLTNGICVVHLSTRPGRTCIFTAVSGRGQCQDRGSTIQCALLIVRLNGKEDCRRLCTELAIFLCSRYSVVVMYFHGIAMRVFLRVLEVVSTRLISSSKASIRCIVLRHCTALDPDLVKPPPPPPARV